MFDGGTVVHDGRKRLNTDLHMLLHESLSDVLIAFFGLHPGRYHRLIRYQQQCTSRNMIGKAASEEGGSWSMGRPSRPPKVLYLFVAKRARLWLCAICLCTLVAVKKLCRQL